MQCSIEHKNDQTPLKHYWAYILLNILFFIQIGIAVSVVLLAEYYKHILGQHLPNVDRDEINTKLYLMELYGVHVFINYVCGLPLIRKCATESWFTSSLVTLLKVWHLFVLSVSVDGFLFGWLIGRSIDFLKKSVEMSMYKGMEVYYSDVQWRILWDDRQYNGQCCGVADYRDWQLLAWFDIVEENQVVE